MNGDQEIERMCKSQGCIAPRVTQDDIYGKVTATEIVRHVTKTGSILRWAVLTMENGFSITGRPSAAVSAENDRAEIGEKIAIENAVSEAWQLEGYLLRERLYQETKNAVNTDIEPDEQNGNVSVTKKVKNKLITWLGGTI